MKSPKSPARQPDDASTRARILDAAEALFAARGFRATSVRQITRRASCNIASISYHFGGKERLYADVVLRRLSDLRRRRMEAIRDALDDAGGRATPELLVRAFASAFVEPLVDQGSARMWMQIVSHEMLDPRLPCETFEREIVIPVQGALAQAMCRVCPGLTRRDALLCAHSLVAQLVHAVQLDRFFGRSRNRRLAADFALPRMVEHVVRFTAIGLRAMARSAV